MEEELKEAVADLLGDSYKSGIYGHFVIDKNAWEKFVQTLNAYIDRRIEKNGVQITGRYDEQG